MHLDTPTKTGPLLAPLTGLLLLAIWTPVWATLQNCTSDQFFTELSTDPKILGYATAYGVPMVKNSVGNDIDLLAVVNAVRQGPEYKVNRIAMSGLQFQALLDASEFGQLSGLAHSQLQTLLTAGGADARLDVTQQNVRDMLSGVIFLNAPKTKQALNNFVNRPGSRIEVVCGAGAVPTLDELAHAIRGESS